ncbi:hypothetical protein HK103_001911 [Boothiomyces macroporosus]|uniref:8-oxo-dGTP diphosphatase n=1 Tax=Boothiomyces macroporosus TaxID=261099 RepID=A0AAD5UM41_9FUNG|nr:hypothetical protein HK103_001911 [Boothiomyces macroporosus]
MTILKAAIGIIKKGDSVFMCQRSLQKSTYPGFWEYPGGKIEPGETAEEAIKRELYEEVGIGAVDIKHLGYWENDSYSIDAFVVDNYTGEPSIKENQIACKWVLIKDADSYKLPPLTYPVNERLRSVYK